MPPAAPINFRQERDLGQIINDTFRFLRHECRPLFRAIAVICLPMALLAGFLLGGSLGAMQQASMDPFGAARAFEGFNFLSMAAAYILLFGAMFVMMAMTYEHLRASEQGEAAMLSTGDLFRRAMGQFWSYFGLAFLTGIISTVAMLFLILPGIWLFVALSLGFVAHSVERTGATGSLSRSYNLVSGNWWSTFGLLIVVYLIITVISYALLLPFTIISSAVLVGTISEPGTGTPLWYGTFMGFMTSFQMGVAMFTYPVFAAALALKYFSLVETKEGVGLQRKLAEFDQA